MLVRRTIFTSSVCLSLAVAADADAQQYPQQPTPQYPQPQPTYPQQPPQYAPPPQQVTPQYPQPQPTYPQQQQQYPAQPPQYAPPGYPQQQQQQQPQGYPQQQQQPYPQQGYPPQQPYPQQGYPQQPYGAPGMAPPLSPPVPGDQRGDGEMAVLYGTSIAYGIGTGIWIDGLGKISDPGLAFIAPLAFGAAMPVGVYLLDEYTTLHRGVPASISAGLALGAVEGIAISGTQWQHSDHGGPGSWSFGAQSTLTFLLATGGGVGGYAFGEWIHPDPRSLAFIGDAAAWGAISGSLLGAGVVSGDWKDGSSSYGLAGFNLGILASGALSVAGYVPSWRSQQAMWLGYVLGTAATSVVYLFYIGSDSDARHGLIANSLGGLAGIGVAYALAGNLKDSDQTSTSKGWTPPFHLGLAPMPQGGMAMSAMGLF